MLRVSFWVKLAFILIEVALAIAFVATSHTHTRNVGAVLEWVVAFIFTGYILSFLLDLLPSVRTRRHLPQGSEGDGQPELARKNQIEIGSGNGIGNGHDRGLF